VLLCLLSACLQTGLSAQRVSEWTSATPSERRALINAVAKRTDIGSSADFLFVIEEAARDADEHVRITAMAAVSGRFGALRFRAAPELATRRSADATIETPTRETVRRLAKQDGSAPVRREALRALINMDASAGQSANGIRLSPDTAATLLDIYRADSDVSVRAEAVKTFALLDETPPGATEVILDALQSDVADLLVYGLLGASGKGLGAGVHRAAALLDHQDRRVRLAAATALQQYGPRATGELPRVQKALAAETDAAVIETLRALLVALQRGK
jgi:hypothetical protein